MHSASDWIGLAGLVVGILGFGIAIWQLHELGARAAAIEAAVAAERRRLSASMLARQAAEMRKVEARLIEAVQDRNRMEAQRALGDWRTVAVDVQASAGSAGVADPELADALAKSLAMLDYAAQNLLDQGVDSISNAMLPKISQTCRLTQSYAAAMMN